MNIAILHYTRFLPLRTIDTPSGSKLTGTRMIVRCISDNIDRPLTAGLQYAACLSHTFSKSPAQILSGSQHGQVLPTRTISQLV